METLWDKFLGLIFGPVAIAVILIVIGYETVKKRFFCDNEPEVHRGRYRRHNGVGPILFLITAAVLLTVLFLWALNQ